ncbi:MAG: radical SAM protein [Verrucomicrobiota bacterium]
MRQLKTIRTYTPVALSNGLSTARQYAHIRSGLRLSRPNMIYVTITERCNLRCKYCHSWKARGEGELPAEVWVRAFTELLGWARHPKINFSGGEPFIRNDIFEILESTTSRGAVTGVGTNGYTMTPRMAPRVVGLGLSNINISIDSLEAKIFDDLRAENRPGHTGRVVESIRRVVSEIRRQEKNTKVYLKAVVCGVNVDSLVPMVRFVEEEGMSGIIFQPLEAVFGTEAPDYGDAWYKHTPLWPKETGRLADIARQLIEMKQRGAPIVTPMSSLEAWAPYFEDPINGIKDHEPAHATGPVRGDRDL